MPKKKSKKKSTPSSQPEPKPFEKILFELMKKYVVSVRKYIGSGGIDIVIPNFDIHKSQIYEYLNSVDTRIKGLLQIYIDSDDKNLLNFIHKDLLDLIDKDLLKSIKNPNVPDNQDIKILIESSSKDLLDMDNEEGVTEQMQETLQSLGRFQMYQIFRILDPVLIDSKKTIKRQIDVSSFDD